MVSTMPPNPSPSRKPLTSAMDNLLAWRMGEICMKAASPDQKVGDPIDRGLILLRLLNESGFEVIADAPR